jgi:hypothetical protein
MVGFGSYIFTSYFVSVELIANGVNTTANGRSNVSDVVTITTHTSNFVPPVFTEMGVAFFITLA